MKLQLATTPWIEANGDWLIVGAPESLELTGPLGALNDALTGQIARLREHKDFTGKLAETVTVPAPAGIRALRLLLVGLGPREKMSDAGLYKALATAARAVSGKKTERVALAVPDLELADISLARHVQIAATAMTVGCVGQDLYRAEKKRFPFENVDLLVESANGTPELRAAVESGTIVGEAMNLARELVNQPAKVIYPDSFAKRAEELARQHNLGCEVLDKPALEREKMGSLLAVSAGSDQPPRMVSLEYNAAGPEAPLLALVGKGVSFDSGRLLIKPNEDILHSEIDTCPAATD